MGVTPRQIIDAVAASQDSGALDVPLTGPDLTVATGAAVHAVDLLNPDRKYPSRPQS